MLNQYTCKFTREIASPTITLEMDICQKKNLYMFNLYDLLFRFKTVREM